MQQELVSVVIPTYNRKEILLKCIDSCLASDYPALEVIVVDNASTDDTAEAVEKNYQSDDRVRLVRLSENMMAAGGRNAGMKVSKGEYILVLDNDNVIFPDMISQLVRAMQDRPDVSYVGALSINKGSGQIWILSGGKVNFWTCKSTDYGCGMPYTDDIQLNRFYETVSAPNAAMIRRSVIDKIGGYDATYYAMFEEIDYGCRLERAGIKAVLCSDARTWHYSYVSEGQQSLLRRLGIEEPKRTWHFARNRSILMKKYAPWYCLPLYFLVTVHALNLAYCGIALSQKQPDIAKAFWTGTWSGIFAKVNHDLYCPM